MTAKSSVEDPCSFYSQSWRKPFPSWNEGNINYLITAIRVGSVCGSFYQLVSIPYRAMVPRIRLRRSKYTFISWRCQELSRSTGKATRQIYSSCHFYFCMVRTRKEATFPAHLLLYLTYSWVCIKLLPWWKWKKLERWTQRRKEERAELIFDGSYPFRFYLASKSEGGMRKSP